MYVCLFYDVTMTSRARDVLSLRVRLAAQAVQCPVMPTAWGRVQHDPHVPNSQLFFFKSSPNSAIAELALRTTWL